MSISMSALVVNSKRFAKIRSGVTQDSTNVPQLCFPGCQKLEGMVPCCTSETTHDGQTVFRRDDEVSCETTTQYLYAKPTSEKAEKLVSHKGIGLLFHTT